MVEGGKAARTLRNKRVQERFDGKDNPVTTRGTGGNLQKSVLDLVHDLEKARIMEVNKWWEKVTLTKYIEYKHIPRGLRILLMPTLNDLGPDLIKKMANRHNRMFI